MSTGNSNSRPGVALAMRHRLCGFNGFRNGDKHPAYGPVGAQHLYLSRVSGLGTAIGWVCVFSLCIWLSGI